MYYNEVYFINALFEVDHQPLTSIKPLVKDLKRVGNYFPNLAEAKEAQGKILKALRSED